MEHPKIWNKKGFRVMLNKGFHIKFENKICVSAQFGPGNYCEHYVNWNRFNRYDIGDTKKHDQWESEDAEIAIWYEGDKEREWITHEFAKQADWANTYEDHNIQVLANVTPEQVLEALNWAKKYEID